MKIANVLACFIVFFLLGCTTFQTAEINAVVSPKDKLLTALAKSDNLGNIKVGYELVMNSSFGSIVEQYDIVRHPDGTFECKEATNETKCEGLSLRYPSMLRLTFMDNNTMALIETMKSEVMYEGTGTSLGRTCDKYTIINNFSDATGKQGAKTHVCMDREFGLQLSAETNVELEWGDEGIQGVSLRLIQKSLSAV